MSRTVFDYVGNLDTLLAVTVGAVLATLGALFAELLTDRMDRRRRARDAARFFGEVLSTMNRLTDRAIESQKIGDPWGPITLRLFRMAQREAGIYERNRERLFDIPDFDLRNRIHTHFLTELIPLEGLIDNSAAIALLEDQLADQKDLAHDKREKLLDAIEENRGSRMRALTLLNEERGKTTEIRRALEKVAGVRFDAAGE